MVGEFWCIFVYVSTPFQLNYYWSEVLHHKPGNSCLSTWHSSNWKLQNCSHIELLLQSLSIPILTFTQGLSLGLYFQTDCSWKCHRRKRSWSDSGTCISLESVTAESILTILRPQLLLLTAGQPPLAAAGATFGLSTKADFLLSVLTFKV